MDLERVSRCVTGGPFHGELYVPGGNPAMGGNFYALAAATGQRLWGKDLRGAIGGGVITYSTGGAQKVAVAVGFTNILWPTKVVTGKIVILALPCA